MLNSALPINYIEGKFKLPGLIKLNTPRCKDMIISRSHSFVLQDSQLITIVQQQQLTEITDSITSFTVSGKKA